MPLFRSIVGFILGLSITLSLTISAHAGKPLCGGVGQQVCDTQAAKSLGRPPNMFECPKGSFFDIGLESCWSCPGGYARTAEAVTTDRACAKRLRTPVRKRARKVADAGCPAGSFWDPIHGGTCWSCPAGFHRSVAGHIEAANACAKATGFLKEDLHSAIKVSGECPNGSFFDGIDGGTCWQCPTGFNRTASSVKASDACIQTERFASAKEVVANKCSGVKNLETGAFWDPINGGTCWTCPKSYPIRTMAPVNSNAACAADKIVWQVQRYNPPGVLGIRGMDAVLAQVASTQPDLIENTARQMAKIINKNPDELVRETWVQLETQPERSLVIRAIAAAKVLDILLSTDRSREEQLLASDFTQHYNALRLHFSTEMKQYYDAYTAACNRRKAQTGMSVVLNYGCKAQEPKDLVMHLMGADIQTKPGQFPGVAVGLSAVDALATTALMTQTLQGLGGVVGQKILPNAVTALSRFTNKLASGVANETARAAIKGISSSATAGLGSATIIAGVGLEIAIISAQQATEIAEQAQQVKQAYRDAQKAMSPAQLSKWVKTETGFNDVKQYLGLMLVAKPGQATQFHQAVLAHNHPTQQTVNTQNTNMRDLGNVKIKGTVVTRNTNNTSNTIKKPKVSAPVWPVNPNSGRFKIALHSGKGVCLAVAGNGNPAPGDTLVLASCAESNVLPFSMVAGRFIATKNNLCLDTQGHAVGDRTPMALFPCKGTIRSQQWQLAPEGKIKSKATKGMLCVHAKGPLAPETQVFLERCHNAPQQVWTSN